MEPGGSAPNAAEQFQCPCWEYEKPLVIVVLKGGKSLGLFLLSSPLFSSPAAFMMLTNAGGQNGFYGHAAAFTGST